MPCTFRALLLAAALSPTVLAAAAHADEAPAAEATADSNVDGVVVTGARARSTGATGLDLSLRETPQSMTIVGQQQIRDFGLTSVTDLLDRVVGINVERVETDRTYFNARGFDVTNFQVDGVGLPLNWGIQYGEIDTILFDRVDVVRGVNGLTTGVGNPSATINYIRKRPIAGFQASAAASYGSWNDKRLEADVSGSLNASGTLSGRLIYANQDRDSYLDHYKVNRNVYYGVLSWDVTPKLNVTGGYSQQDNLATGVLWGALPLSFSDGSRIPWKRSASTSADWSYWDVNDKTAFVEASYLFDNAWVAKATYTHKDVEQNAKLLYASGYPDKTTGLGIGGFVGHYPSESKQDLADLTFNGPVSLFGRTHQLVFGASYAEQTREDFASSGATYPAYPSVYDWGSVAEPTTYTDLYSAAQIKDRLTRVFGAAHLNFTDRLKGVVGFNAVEQKTSGISYGVDQGRTVSKTSPYAGLVFDLTPHVSLYGSYTDIFNPQAEVDASNRKLDPVQGESFEAGVKSEWFGGKLYASAAVFKVEQQNLATAAGTFGAGDPGPVGFTYYTGVDTTSKGYELEISGMVTDRWQVSGGWTQLSLEDKDGEDARTFLPRKSLKVSTTYSFPKWRNAKVGASLRWQDEISGLDTFVVTQKAYAVVDLMGSADLTDQIKLTVNVRNLFDESYLNSVMWGQAYYAAPRNASVRLDYRF
ncbi:TonB-dependent siderophore receptor [Caulobacter radicis]|uniref:TonB-dependent siderophore receptor n=1 Tax=Caulobacter radicis TaxID=2172650 RepID=A0A2T9J9G5_9CAUL|nr:TonB-dependent siderophore receptor [Caulobacter radicis]PVM78483.1 TonB-dependent siderophore receptor [Caulobacter radicis]